MTETPYPLPASTRQTDWLLGNGGTTYGPFGEGWGIFDTDDVKVETRPAAGGAVSLATVTVTKTVLAERYGTFSITFPAAITAATAFRVTGLRLHERDLAVTRGGSIDGLALEQELSKVAVVLQEQRRDIDDLEQMDIAASVTAAQLAEANAEVAQAGAAASAVTSTTQAGIATTAAATASATMAGITPGNGPLGTQMANDKGRGIFLGNDALVCLLYTSPSPRDCS